MQSIKTFVFSNFRCKNNIFYLALFWCLSIMLGMLLASVTKDYTASLMHTVVSNRVSIFGLAVVLLFPLFISAVVVRLSVPRLIYLISVTKGICCGFCIYVLVMTYGSAGWLFRCLLLFSDSCMLIPLFLFWIRHIDGSRKQLRHDTVCCVLFALLVGFIDYWGVSPYITTLV